MHLLSGTGRLQTLLVLCHAMPTAFNLACLPGSRQASCTQPLDWPRPGLQTASSQAIGLHAGSGLIPGSWAAGCQQPDSWSAVNLRRGGCRCGGRFAAQQVQQGSAQPHHLPHRSAHRIQAEPAAAIPAGTAQVLASPHLLCMQTAQVWRRFRLPEQACRQWDPCRELGCAVLAAWSGSESAAGGLRL